MRALWLTLLFFFVVPSTARADDGPAYDLSWGVDGTALLLSGSVAAAFLVNKEVPGNTCLPCDRSK